MSLRYLIEELLESTMSVADARAHLGLPPQWSPSELKSAFKKAAFDNHPDRGGSTAKMSAINLAYKVLQKVKPGSLGGEDFETKWADRIERNGRMVVQTVNSLFDPAKYSQYFTKMTGKPYTFEVDDKLRTGKYGGNYFRKKVEWTSGDKETIFSLELYVDLVHVDSIKSLGGEGGEPALAFKVMVEPTVLHDNRKSKMRKKNWDFSTKQETLVDPTKVFPKASIKKMVAGKDKARKFSKRDMLTAIEHRLKGETDQSGGTVWARIPVGDYKLNLYRMTFYKMASWDLHSVRALVPTPDKPKGVWKTFRPKVKGGSYLEREELIELLKKIQQHKWNDPQTLADTVAHQMKVMQDAAIAKEKAGKAESVKERMAALL